MTLYTHDERRLTINDQTDAIIETYVNAITFGNVCRSLQSDWKGNDQPLGPGFSESMFRLALIHFFMYGELTPCP
jgi:hypothetical protein